jgi:Stress responsive A/B Barrel Domain
MKTEMDTNIRHAGLLKFKSTITEEEKQAFFIALKDLEQIEGVQKMEISKQISPKTLLNTVFQWNLPMKAFIKPIIFTPNMMLLCRIIG